LDHCAVECAAAPLLLLLPLAVLLRLLPPSSLQAQQLLCCGCMQLLCHWAGGRVLLLLLWLLWQELRLQLSLLRVRLLGGPAAAKPTLQWSLSGTGWYAQAAAAQEEQQATMSHKNALARPINSTVGPCSFDTIASAVTCKLFPTAQGHPRQGVAGGM
jgi:hypothetical protein